MKLQIGDKVKVKSICDETGIEEFIGSIGVIREFNANGQTGNTKKDPLIIVEFKDKGVQSFWTEELEKL